MKFFRAEDFEMQEFSPEQAAAFANGKLERFNSRRTLYGTEYGYGLYYQKSPEHTIMYDIIVLNRKVIPKCVHPKERIAYCCIGSFENGKVIYNCECGARVEPASFKESGA